MVCPSSFLVVPSEMNKYFVLQQPHRVDAEATGTIEVGAFNQILELDDDDSYTYSKDMIAMYFAQVPTAFAGMDAALASKDLRELADLAHFLMGSSASLGIARVAASCAGIEGIGKASLKATEQDSAHDSTEALAEIGVLLGKVKREYRDAQTWLRRWYSERGESFDEEVDIPESDEKPEQDSEPTVASDDAVDIWIPPPAPPPQTATPEDAP
ncbi:signal transduction histidine kinase [Mycena maculata]|uniref:Signal transduction histidine kinase n=1 Tax=Mycena maculata TaxID=230809 RepID=A0AAD7HWD7_9AGAR|nr:signal transduction histidine kinase [Mycena maculata]